MKIFAEIGFGNSSFRSTEIEKGRLGYRVKKEGVIYANRHPLSPRQTKI